MANCDKCLHAGVCGKLIWEERDGSIICDDFKDRSRFVELPCNVGDAVYVITYCRCANPECYDNRHCHKKETKRTPKVLAGAMVQQKGRKTKWNGFEHSWEWKPIGTICYRVYQKPFETKMFSEIGKTVFLTLDEAKKAIALMVCAGYEGQNEGGCK